LSVGAPQISIPFLFACPWNGAVPPPGYSTTLVGLEPALIFYAAVSVPASSLRSGEVSDLRPPSITVSQGQTGILSQAGVVKVHWASLSLAELGRDPLFLEKFLASALINFTIKVTPRALKDSSHQHPSFRPFFF